MRACCELQNSAEPPGSKSSGKVRLVFQVYMLWRAGDGRGRLTSLAHDSLLTLELYDAILSTANPVFQTTPGTYLTAAVVLESLHLHTVTKDQNPFRQDPLAEAIREYWTAAAGLGIPVEDLLLCFVVTLAGRSLTLAQALAKSPDTRLSAQDALPKLYGWALEFGNARLGDPSTRSTSLLSLGTIVDTILFPYWLDKRTHAVWKMSHASCIEEAFSHMAGVPHFSDLALGHVFQYLQAADRGVGKLAWSQSSVPTDLATIGSNSQAFLHLRRMSRGLPVPSDAQQWLAEEVRHWKASLERLWPGRVEFTRLDDGVVVPWQLAVDVGILQANACKCLQLLQSWLSGSLGSHGRRGRQKPVWKRKTWMLSRKRQRPSIQTETT